MNSGGDNGRGDAPIGAILEQARRERGLSLGQAEDATKIRKRYLEGLEREDYTVLPDAVYVQGFLKTYANFLGLDGEVLSREFKNRRFPRRERQVEPGRLRRSDFEKPLVSPGGLADAERRRISGATIVTVALAVIVLALIIGLLYLVGSRSANSPSPSNDPPAQAEGRNRDDAGSSDQAGNEQPAARAEAPQEPPEEPREPAAASEGSAGEEPASEESPRGEPARKETDTVTVVASVPEIPVGMTVRTDGEVAADLVAQPGYSESFEARETVEIEAANGGAVAVEVDGEDRGFLAAFGQPVTRAFGP